MHQPTYLATFAMLNWSAAAALNCSASSFASILPTNASLNYAVHVPANGSFGGGTEDLGFPGNATGLPELCALSVNVPTPGNTSYNFGLYLPVDWNKRYLAVGQGGFAGGINWPSMATYVQYGFAVVSTDTGHVSTAVDGSWAYQAPEKITNWGYRALHGSVDLGKKLVAAYYAGDIAYSYYSGCSTGGRQGLKEVEEFPDDFDGALLGAPAWWTNRLQTWTTWIGKLNLPADSPHHVSNALTAVLANEVLKQCDPQDGVEDGIISDPYGCNVFLEALLCSSSNASSSCFTGAQLETVQKLYDGWVDANQTFVFPGYSKSSEAGWPALIGGSAPNPLGTGFEQFFLQQGPNWDWNEMDYSYVQLADKVNPGNATANNFNLSPFKAKGGKIIQYHGLSDPLIPAGSSLYFYKQVANTLKPTGINLDDFYRLFLIPNMGHCSGTSNDAPFYFAGSEKPKVSDSTYGALLALMKWTEEGTAPDQLVATKFQNDSITGGIVRERPICPHPKQARYSGSGNVNASASWTCQFPWLKTQS